MPRPRKAVPSYRHHKASNQAFVILYRQDGSQETVYLGVYDTPESREAYARVISGERPAGGRPREAVEPPSPPVPTLTVSDLASRFLAHAGRHYRHKDGTPTGEAGNYAISLRPLLFLFADLPAVEFGPKCLKAVRTLMLDGYTHPDHGEQPGVCRRVINSRVGRIVRVWKWAVSEELVPPAVYQALATVPGLQAGRSEARETEPVAPVPWETVEATLPHLNPEVKAMVLLLWHTGMRPGECCAIRAADIDRTGQVWLFKPAAHKTAYRGKVRAVPIGKQGQEVLAPFLDRPGFLFSPSEATAAVRASQAANRKTRRFPCEDRRRARRCQQEPRCKPGERYTPPVLCKAIVRACRRAGVEEWHPNQLRHAFGTRVRHLFGLEACQVVLGHSHAAISEIYGERNEALALTVAQQIG